ncbi:MAG: KpsF/GutQ family sugar-phosphate isomerase [Planctomycetes bacterium]|nr:KpsF/GutQ family sugar-phosphate isomerase [Planctomycetota bacterium]
MSFDKTSSETRRRERAAAIIRCEAKTIARLEERLDTGFDHAVEAVLKCQGQVVVTGMGKAGLVGQKISATLASTGTPSFFLHPAEALHGDLGRIRAQDLLLAMSNSGETEEVTRLVPAARKIGAAIVCLTGRPTSNLGRLSDAVLDIGAVEEAGTMKLAPTASTAAMMAMGDALALVVAEERGFNHEDFARFHPGGSIGRRLMRIGEVMRQGTALPLVAEHLTVAQVLIQTSTTLGRPGAALVVDKDGCLAGIFTDGDLRRLLEGEDRSILDDPVSQHMGANPKTLSPDQLVEEAHHLLRQYRIDQAPVVDSEGKPVGLIDVQDLLDVEI